MTCPRCNSYNVNVNITNEVRMKNAHHGVFWWLFIGWWWVIIKWVYFFWIALAFKIFGSKKQKAENIQHKMCVCQQCGYSWEMK